MPSEQSPGGSRPRMTKYQIKKLQEQQAEARRIASEKIIAAKHSDEWKKEQKILADLEEKLEVDEASIHSESVEIKKEQEIKLSFWEELILFLKRLFK